MYQEMLLQRNWWKHCYKERTLLYSYWSYNPTSRRSFQHKAWKRTKLNRFKNSIASSIRVHITHPKLVKLAQQYLAKAPSKSVSY